MSNNASRARSLVGRTALPPGAAMARPRCLPPMIRMALAARRFAGGGAELLAQHAARHLFDIAARQLAQLKRAIGDADEARHLQAQMLHDAADLAVLALAQA